MRPSLRLWLLFCLSGILFAGPLASASQSAAGTRAPALLPPPTGGPDAGGYCFRDSTVAGETFSFTDISTTGAALTLGDPDDSMVNGVALPFAFTFYGAAFNSVSVSSNGFLRLNYAGTSTSPTNDTIPTAAAPTNLLAAYWDDLIWRGAVNLRTQTIGDAGSRQFIVQWTNVSLFDFDTNPAFTFQIRLYEGSNDIVFSYYLAGVPPTAPGTPTSHTAGDGATIGIENGTGSTGLLYGFNAAVLSNSLQIRFTRTNCVAPTSTPTDTPTSTGTPTDTPTSTGTPTIPRQRLYLPLIGNSAPAAARIFDALEQAGAKR
ncbi:MAG TPA: hypothetical protein VGE07_14730 [Herpetosiphonaceae bacterium]